MLLSFSKPIKVLYHILIYVFYIFTKSKIFKHLCKHFKNYKSAENRYDNIALSEDDDDKQTCKKFTDSLSHNNMQCLTRMEKFIKHSTSGNSEAG